MRVLDISRNLINCLFFINLTINPMKIAIIIIDKGLPSIKDIWILVISKPNGDNDSDKPFFTYELKFNSAIKSLFLGKLIFDEINNEKTIAKVVERI